MLTKLLFVAMVVAVAWVLGCQSATGPEAATKAAPAKKVLVTSSWDDGDINDVRLAELLRKYHAKGTFFIFPAKYVELRDNPEAANKRDKRLIPFDQFLKAYDGLEVAAHGYHHPDMRKLPPEELKFELTESRRVLAEWFHQPVLGMAYPGGARDANVDRAVQAAGYVYARSVGKSPHVFPPANPYDFTPSLHFQDKQFWPEFERVKAEGGVFYFWGHSYELRTEEQWQEFERNIARLSADPAVQWVTNIELFQAKRASSQ